MTYDIALQMRGTAYHEAAHVVVGIGFGWEVHVVEIHDDATGFAQHRRDPRDHVCATVVSMAGSVAEQRVHGSEVREDDEELEEALLYPDEPFEGADDTTRTMESLWLWFYRDTDIDTVREAARHLGALGGEPGAFLVERYREAERFAEALVARPDVWSSIEAVAAALLARGRLGHEDVMALVDDSLRGAPLIEALVTELKAGWDQLDPPCVVFEMAD